MSMGLCIFKRYVQCFPCLNLLKPVYLCCCMPAKALSSPALNHGWFMNNLLRSALNYTTSLLVLSWVVAWASCSRTPLASTSRSSPGSRIQLTSKWWAGCKLGGSLWLPLCPPCSRGIWHATSRLLVSQRVIPYFGLPDVCHFGVAKKPTPHFV